MPTEAEWEYAARGGEKDIHGKYAGADDEINLDSVAWYVDNSDVRAHTVGTKKPNELGIYDMSGNVKEWCSDQYNTYESKDQINPTGPTTSMDYDNAYQSTVDSGVLRVARGGSALLYSDESRVVSRDSYSPSSVYPDIGLRLVLVPPSF
jgi:formylglycine-generating enzyme required for sulfatase activity